MKQISGLYLVMDDKYFHPALFFSLMEEVFPAGVNTFQFRLKRGEPVWRLKWAKMLRKMAQDFGVTFIVNDYPGLAADCDADGVHFNLSDVQVAIARKILGEGKIIGVSVGGDLDKAKESAEQGVNYVSMGAVFRSPTKPNRPVIGLSPIQQAKAELTIPVVAIGGITPANAPQVLNAGADAIAVISSVFSHPHPARVVMRFRQVWISVRGEIGTVQSESRESSALSRSEKTDISEPQ